MKRSSLYKKKLLTWPSLPAKKLFLTQCIIRDYIIDGVACYHWILLFDIYKCFLMPSATAQKNVEKNIW